ncbi:MAG: CHAT domain-containing protein [candidate division Zixibacteria bacterium]|nr:CHAT domain-containing protein [candidate division Zixibacteria bacterium]
MWPQNILVNKVALIILCLLVYLTISFDPCYATGNSIRAEISGLIDRADSLKYTGDLDKAKAMAEEAVRIARENSDSLSLPLSDALIKLGNILEHMRNQGMSGLPFHDIIFHLYSEALEIRRRELDSMDVRIAAAIRQLVSEYTTVGEYKKVLSYTLQTLEISKHNYPEDDNRIISQKLAVSRANRILGRYYIAEEIALNCLDLISDNLDSENILPQFYKELGIIYQQLARYSEAEDYLLRGIRMFKEKDGFNSLSECLSRLGNVYRYQGKYGQAESCYKESYDLRIQSLRPAHQNIAEPLGYLGQLYISLGRYTEAESCFTQAIKLRRNFYGDEHPFLFYALVPPGDVYLHRYSFAEAGSLYNWAYQNCLDGWGMHHENTALCIERLGNLNLVRGQYAKSISYFEQALNINRQTLGEYHPRFAENARSLALNYAALGNHKMCRRFFKELLESRQQFITDVFQYASEEQKMRYLRTYPLMDHALLSYALTTQSNEAKAMVSEMILNGKAAVLDAVAAEKEVAFCSHDERIALKAEKYSEVCSEIAALAIAGVDRMGGNVDDEHLRELYSAKDSLEIELSSQCSDFQQALSRRKIRKHEITRIIPEDAVLWEFLKYRPYDYISMGRKADQIEPSRYLAIALDSRGRCEMIDLGDAVEIDGWVTECRKLFNNAPLDIQFRGYHDSAERLKSVASELYGSVFAPLQHTLRSKSKIIIAPDGQLNLIPFEILPISDEEYVIEEYSISYVSSGRDLLKFNEDITPAESAALFANPDFDSADKTSREIGYGMELNSGYSVLGYEPARGTTAGCFNRRFDPLPYTQEEYKLIKNILNKDGDISVYGYTGKSACESKIKELDAPPQILHFCTHSFFCEDIDFHYEEILDNPLLRSGIVLAGANCRVNNGGKKNISEEEDGILTALEVSSLNLFGTELVTLSGCQTGVGEVRTGEGVYGLRRAFQCAGAKSILMSLWSVSDRTTCGLMENFYRNWLNGKTKREALRAASLKILNDQRQKHGAAHPYYWGAFILLGDPN